MRAIINGEIYFVDTESYTIGCAAPITIDGLEYILPVVRDGEFDERKPVLIYMGRSNVMLSIPDIDMTPYLKENAVIEGQEAMVHFLREGNPTLSNHDEIVIVQDNNDLFRPPIGTEDNLLNRIAKQAFYDAPFSLKSKAHLFDKPSDMNNFKSSMKHPTMSWDKFVLSMLLADMGVEIRVYDKKGKVDDRIYNI